MDRMRVVLLDDEALIRKLIRMKLNIDELNLDIVGEFSNGAMALDALQDLKPDILISDICMPEMDGISFSEQCLRRFPEVKVIIVTGYNDFDYARRSLKAGVFDYIMKPVQTEELNKTLEKAIEQIQRERQMKEKQNRILEQRKKDLPLLRSIFLRNLLIEQQTASCCNEKMKEYGIDIDSAEKYGIKLGVLVILEDILNSDVIGYVKKEAETFFQNDKDTYVILDPWGRIVIVCGCENEAFEKCFYLLAELIGKKWNCRIQFGYAMMHCGYADLKAVYIKAIEDMHINYGANKINKKQFALSRHIDWKPVIISVLNGKTEEAVISLDSIIEQAKQGENVVFSKEMVLALLTMFYEEFDKTKYADAAKIKLELCRCEDDGIRCLRNFIMNVAMQTAIEKDRTKGKMMIDVMKYVENHLGDENMTMNQLTQIFSVSSSYLNRMFRKFAGKSYGEFVAELRFWRTLKLLSHEQEFRDWEIGDAVGIKDAHYFCIWFKKMTSYSMTEYRKLEYK